MNTSTFNIAAHGEAIKNFARLCVANPEVASAILCKQGDPGFTATVHALMGHPGAIEALVNAETTPRWLKAAVQETLADFGQVMLS